MNSLVRSLGKDNFKYLSQEYYSNIFDLIMQKGFYPHECMSSVEKFRSSLNGKKNNDKDY